MKEEKQRKYDNSKGITLVALIITVIVMLILLTISVEFGSKQIDQAKLEDLKTEMIAIKGKAKIIAEKNSFDNTSPLVGTQMDSNDTNNFGTGDFYRWSQQDLNDQGLNTIEADNKYVVRYFATNLETNQSEIDVEIYIADGYDYNEISKYSLSEIENIQ